MFREVWLSVFLKLVRAARATKDAGQVVDLDYGMIHFLSLHASLSELAELLTHSHCCTDQRLVIEAYY